MSYLHCAKNLLFNVATTKLFFQRGPRSSIQHLLSDLKEKKIVFKIGFWIFFLGSDKCILTASTCISKKELLTGMIKNQANVYNNNIKRNT